MKVIVHWLPTDQRDLHESLRRTSMELDIDRIDTETKLWTGMAGPTTVLPVLTLHRKDLPVWERPLRQVIQIEVWP